MNNTNHQNDDVITVSDVDSQCGCNPIAPPCKGNTVLGAFGNNNTLFFYVIVIAFLCNSSCGIDMNTLFMLFLLFTVLCQN